MNKKELEKQRRKQEDEKLKQECEEVYRELDVIGLPVIMPDIVRYNKALKSTLGRCQMRSVYISRELCRSAKRPCAKGVYLSLVPEYIEISDQIKEFDKLRKEVLAHELLHTAVIVAGVGHNGEFYELCKIAEKAYHYGLFDESWMKNWGKEGEYRWQCFKCGRYAYGDNEHERHQCPYCDNNRWQNMAKVKKIDFSFLDMDKNKWRKIKREEMGIPSFRTSVNASGSNGKK